MMRAPIRPAANIQRTLGTIDNKYGAVSHDICPLPQTFPMQQLNIEGPHAYSPNIMYMAPLHGLVRDMVVSKALFGLGCGVGYDVGHAIYRLTFSPSEGLVFRLVWGEWFTGDKGVLVPDEISPSVHMSQTEQFFLAAVSNEDDGSLYNSHVLAYQNPDLAFPGPYSGLAYTREVLIPGASANRGGFPDKIKASDVTHTAEFILGGYCLPQTHDVSSSTFGIVTIF